MSRSPTSSRILGKSQRLPPAQRNGDATRSSESAITPAMLRRRYPSDRTLERQETDDGHRLRKERDPQRRRRSPAPRPPLGSPRERGAHNCRDGDSADTSDQRHRAPPPRAGRDQPQRAATGRPTLLARLPFPRASALAASGIPPAAQPLRASPPRTPKSEASVRRC